MAVSCGIIVHRNSSESNWVALLWYNETWASDYICSPLLHKLHSWHNLAWAHKIQITNSIFSKSTTAKDLCVSIGQILNSTHYSTFFRRNETRSMQLFFEEMRLFLVARTPIMRSRYAYFLYWFEQKIGTFRRRIFSQKHFNCFPLCCFLPKCFLGAGNRKSFQ